MAPGWNNLLGQNSVTDLASSQVMKLNVLFALPPGVFRRDVVAVAVAAFDVDVDGVVLLLGIEL